VTQKTVGRWLNADQARVYAHWVDNDRRAHELLGRLEALGVAALEAELEQQRGTAAAAAVQNP
jgi:hypothetical protein